VEAVVIAGGRDSANTRRLLAIAQGEGRPSWLVEGAGELPVEIAAYRTVGLSAGASTPEAVIAEIEDVLRR
jgi:4-hydroxy-3-methylbut-2-enyl diphosphate reductase